MFWAFSFKLLPLTSKTILLNWLATVTYPGAGLATRQRCQAPPNGAGGEVDIVVAIPCDGAGSCALCKPARATAESWANPSIRQRPANDFMLSSSL